jgi:3-deoxy-D-manno-octulosonic-acid transferase
LSVFFYNVFLWLFRAGTHIASLFNPKARKWVRGRKGIFEKLEQTIPGGEKIVWVHCASLGEFEQGRPVIEQLKKEYPRYKILLTFFSPSGFEVQKNYKGADWVFYLPLDGPRTAKRFLEIAQPSLVIFVKYEFWFYYLKKIKYRNIPLILISALFREDMSFFKWYGKLQRKMLSRFDHLFVQNESSKKLLDDIGLASITSVSGDTRFDRVAQIAEASRSLPLIEAFIGGQKAVVAGSTWKNDEEQLKKTGDYLTFNKIKLIIAPHEINPSHIEELQLLFPGSLLYSSLAAGETKNADVLIIDNIGMLAALYKYAWCSYIGGGFNRSGVHNVVEAAVYGKPVFFGPFYEKYREACELVELKGAYAVKDSDELVARLNFFRLDAYAGLYEETCDRAMHYVMDNKGAVDIILRYIQEKRLLTN